MDTHTDSWRTPIAAVSCASVYAVNWGFSWTSWPPNSHLLFLCAGLAMPSVVYDLYRLTGRWLKRDREPRGEFLLTADPVLGERTDD